MLVAANDTQPERDLFAKLYARSHVRAHRSFNHQITPHRGSQIPARMCWFAQPGRRDEEASFFTVTVWRDQAAHGAES